MTDDSRLMFESSATHHRVMTPLVTVSRRQDLPTLAERLAEVQAWLDSDLQVLDTALAEVEQCSGSPNLAERSARHLLRRKGKRLRPICTYLGARLAGLSQDDRVADLAVAAELVHAATLLHDDVIDEGNERRGEPAARIMYGNSASILGGDYLLIEALERVRRVDAGAPLSKILETITHMVSSEALQLEQRGRFVPDRDIYYRIIEGKTASLFRWALSAAPLMVGSDAAEPLARMGLELGLAFQLVDDALDLEGDPAEIGKAPQSVPTLAKQISMPRASSIRSSSTRGGRTRVSTPCPASAVCRPRGSYVRSRRAWTMGSRASSCSRLCPMSESRRPATKRGIPTGSCLDRLRP